MRHKIVVIGAGASGVMAAIRAAEKGAGVIILEKMPQLGKKLSITGQGRCNLTNTKSLNEFISMFGINGHFLYGAFNQFFRDDLIKLLGCWGVNVKDEPDGRVFPISEKADDVVRALEQQMTKHKIQILLTTKADDICIHNNHITAVHTDRGIIHTETVILATGGASYPSTGSSGDGYTLASSVGHSIIKLRPAFVPLVVRETALVKALQGVSLRDVRLTAYVCQKDIIKPSMEPKQNTGRGISGKQPHISASPDINLHNRQSDGYVSSRKSNRQSETTRPYSAHGSPFAEYCLGHLGYSGQTFPAYNNPDD